jgi:hypothetical protein
MPFLCNAVLSVERERKTCRVVGVRGGCGCTPIFLQGMSRPSIACIVSCFKSLIAEKNRFFNAPLM